jgi:hypothetical protein
MKSILRDSSAWLVILLALLMAGCGSHPKRVDCDGHLRPINAPAPVPSTSGTSP